MNRLWINRGLPGSGKSYRTRQLVERLTPPLTGSMGTPVLVCSSDDYFVCPHCKEYVFIKERLGAAHRTCQMKCESGMKSKVPHIIIDNTCVSCSECKPYVEMALKYDYKVEFLEPQTPWAFDLDELAKRNIHKVPRHALEGMLRRWVPDMTVEKAMGLHMVVDAAPPHLDELAARGEI